MSFSTVLAWFHRSFTCFGFLILSWLNTVVPKKKKLKKFTATSAVKAASRAVLGTPPPVKRAENKKHSRKPKHKPSIEKLRADADRG